MSGRLEREPTEVGPAYVMCSPCLSRTHMHTQAQHTGWGWWGGGMFEDSCQILTVMPHAALFAKDWLSGAITFITMYVQRVPWKLFMALLL